MDHARCSIVYLDRRARKTALWKREDLKSLEVADGPEQLLEKEEEGVGHNIRVILATFEEGTCTTQGYRNIPLTDLEKCTFARMVPRF